MKSRSEKEIINKALKASGNNAYLKTLRNGVAGTVLRDNKVCKIGPDGETTVIANIYMGVRKEIKSRTIKIR